VTVKMWLEIRKVRRVNRAAKLVVDLPEGSLSL
jgi:hypothetical protein